MYYGYTSDLKKRLKEHNDGNSTFTKGHRPWILECYTAFKNEQKSRDFELYLKSGSGKAFVYKRLVELNA